MVGNRPTIRTWLLRREKFLVTATRVHNAGTIDAANRVKKIRAADVADAKPPSSGITRGSMREQANSKVLSDAIRTIPDLDMVFMT